MTWQTSFSGAQPSGFCEWLAPVNRVAILCFCAVLTDISLGEILSVCFRIESILFLFIYRLNLHAAFSYYEWFMSFLIFRAQNVEVILLKELEILYHFTAYICFH